MELTPATDEALARRVRLTYMYLPEDQAIATELLAARKLLRALHAELYDEAAGEYIELEAHAPASAQLLEDHIERWGLPADADGTRATSPEETR